MIILLFYVGYLLICCHTTLNTYMICEYLLSSHMRVYMVELLACDCSLIVHVGLDPEYEG